MGRWSKNLFGALFAAYCASLAVGQTLGMSSVSASNKQIGPLAPTATYTTSGTTYYLLGGSNVVLRSSDPSGTYTTFISTLPAGSRVTSMAIGQLSDPSQARLAVCVATSSTSLRAYFYTLSGSSVTYLNRYHSWTTNTPSGSVTINPVCYYDVNTEYLWIASYYHIVQVRRPFTDSNFDNTRTSLSGGYKAFSVVYEPVTKRIVYGLSDGYFLIFRSESSGFGSSTSRKLGAWNQNYGIYNSPKKSMIFVSDAGIVSEVAFGSSGTLSLTGIYLEADTSFIAKQ